MKPASIRRFSIAEIVLHWANAVLYLALFITGTLILINRIFEVEIALPENLSLIHRIAGISLISFLALTIILTIFVKGFRQLWDSLRQCLTWKLSEIAWLTKVPFNMLFKHVVLPPAGRFNAGQKLHLLALFIILSGFSLSGIMMIIAPGILIAWVVHLICFIPAALFLLLHLFLSLINPSTRKSLPAIFTGFISAEYAHKHHPLWTGSKESQSHGSYVSWKAVAITAMVAASMLTLLYVHNGRHILQSIQTLISQRGTTSILPGPLTKSHADDPELKYCSVCHQNFLTPSSDACLSCHKIIKHRMIQQSGFHGKMTGQCRSCHRDHLGEDADIRNFDITQFDHNLATFKLQGTHSKLPCSKCHLVKADENTSVQTKYIGLPTTCDKCHANIKKLSEGIANKISSKPDPHAGRVTCRQCHQVDKQKQKPADYANKCKSCHNDKYEQLYYDWSKVFDMRALHAETLLLKLSDEDALQSTQLTERVKEANEIGFHNIDLANKLWNQIFSEAPTSIE